MPSVRITAYLVLELGESEMTFTITSLNEKADHLTVVVLRGLHEDCKLTLRVNNI